MNIINIVRKTGIRIPPLRLFIFLALFCVQAAGEVVDGDSKNDVLFKTSLGDFIVRPASDAAPKTVTNFISLVDSGFYNNTLFHRVIPGFMIQGGGFESGMKEKREGPTVINESRNGLSNVKGSVAMARLSDPDSARAQFFINLADNKHLDSSPGKAGYTVFGEVIYGMSIVEEISKVATHRHARGDGNVPVQDVVILSSARSMKTIGEITKGEIDNKAKSIKDVEDRNSSLPVTVRKDKYMLSLTKHLNLQQYEESLFYFDLLDRLNVELSSSFDYFWGEALLRTNQPNAAIDKLYQYINKAGSQGRYYTKALELTNEAEAKL